MPQLAQDNSSKDKYILPSTKDLPEADQAWVILRKGRLLGGDIVVSAEVTSERDFALAVLATRVEEWNFTEADGTTTPISVANVRRMEPEDLAFLLTELSPTLSTGTEDVLSDPKKNEPSSPTSTQ